MRPRPEYCRGLLDDCVDGVVRCGTRRSKKRSVNTPFADKRTMRLQGVPLYEVKSPPTSKVIGLCNNLATQS